jgi:hypothetical protein
MSSGAFQIAKYESDLGTIHRIRIQPETLMGAANPQPAGAVNSPLSAKRSLTRRSVGLRPRFITVKVPATPPAGYKAGSTLVIPILTAAAHAGFQVGNDVTYLEVAMQITGKEPERAR